HVEVRRVGVAIRRLYVTGSALREDRAVMIVAGVLHAYRIEDVLLQHLLVWFTRDVLDDGAQEKVPGVVVQKLRTRLELEIAARILLHKLIDLVRIAAHVLEEAWLARITRNA